MVKKILAKCSHNDLNVGNFLDDKQCLRLARFVTIFTTLGSAAIPTKCAKLSGGCSTLRT